MTKIVSTYNAIEYYISQSVKTNDFSENPFEAAIQFNLTEYDFDGNYNVKINHHYDLLASIIFFDFDKLSISKEELKKRIEVLIQEYKRLKSNETANELKDVFYYSFLLFLQGKNEPYLFIKKLGIEAVVAGILKSQTQLDSKSALLTLILNNKIAGINRSSKSISSLANSLLIKSICIKKGDESQSLPEFHLLCREIEDLLIQKSYTLKQVLETGLIVKSALGRGVYVPSSKVDEYFSISAKNYLFHKYTEVLKKALTFDVKGYSVPIYALPVLVFIFEYLIFKSGLVSELSLGPAAIDEETIKKGEHFVHYIFNPILLILFFIHLTKKIKTEIKNVEI